jgi:hypothetical protein
MRFACYPAQFSGFRAQPATFVDEFSRSVSLVVQVPQAVCAPAPGSSASYLTCYRVTVRRTRFLVRTRRVVDEFTKTPLAVRVSALLTLCAPSARVDAGASSPRGLDFFTCYAAKPSRVIAANGVLENPFPCSRHIRSMRFRGELVGFGSVRCFAGELGGSRAHIL